MGSGMSMDKEITIKLPESLPYAEIMPVDQVKQLDNKFCYVIEEYPRSGIGFLVLRQHEHVCIRLSDFKGNIIDANDPGEFGKDIKEIMSNYSQRIITTMSIINIPQALFYFSCGEKTQLVDMMLSINRFCGPGYLGDFFGKQGIPTQEVVGTPCVLNKENLSKISSGVGTYEFGRFILKPSVFKFMIRDDTVVPMYGRVWHETKATT